MKIDFYPLGSQHHQTYTYAVIVTRHKKQLVLVKHKDRQTLEYPGGRWEPGESINETATRELIEESGAQTFEITPVSDYSVTINNVTTFGCLFLADVTAFNATLTHEIESIGFYDTLPENLTYPEIMKALLDHINKNYKIDK